MKKIISFLIIAAMLFSTLPVFATEVEPAVTLTYVKDGESYAAGSTVILGASAGVVVFDRIDFYANGIKIPGCIKSSGKTLNWTIPTSGKFEIQAFATTSLGESLPSDKITVYGVASEKPFLKFDTADDVAQIYGKNYALETIPKENANSEFVKNSNFSAPFGPMRGAAERQFTIKGLNVNIGTADPVYLNYLMYASNDIVLRSSLTDYVRSGKTDVTGPDKDHTRPNDDNGVNGFIPLKAGWNMLSVSVRDNISNGYYAVGAVIDNINEISFTTYQDNKTIPSDPALYGENAGKKLNAQTNIENTVVYLDSAWVSSAPMAAPKATCSIPTGSTKVCNALDKLTFTFDKEMDFSVLSDADITVKNNTDDIEIENFTLIPSTNTLIVDFAPNTLAYNKEYTVTLGDNIKDFYGKSVDSTTKTFTFTTVQSCEAVEPIVSLTYPEKNATLISNNVTLAAKVIFGGSVKGVAFYEGTDKIADATQGTNGEWYATVDGMSAASHTVKAVVTYGDTDATKETDAVSFTVSEALEYNFTGIKHGEEITLNTTAQPLVSKEIGITPVTNVSKVVYKLDGVEKATVTEAPFTWDMPITAVNKNVVVSADVYSVGVNPVSAVTYSALYIEEGIQRDNATSNFDEDSGSFTSGNGIFKTAQVRTNAYSYSYADATTEQLGRTGNVVKIDRDETNNSTDANKGSLLGTQGVSVSDANGSNPRVKFSFDFYLPEGKAYSSNDKIFIANLEYASYQDGVICDLSKFATGQWHSVVAYLDVANRTVTGNVGDVSTITKIGIADNNGEDYMLYSSNNDPKVGLYIKSFSDMYIDNVRVTRAVESERTDLFVNGIKKDVTASGATVNVSVANLTAANSKVSVIIALYTEDNEMIAVYPFEDVDVKSNEFKQIVQNVSYTVDGKAGKVVKAFVVNNMNDITPVKTIR